MKLIPLFSRVLLKPVMKSLKTESGLIMNPDKEEEKTSEAIVYTLGTGEAVKESGLKEGDVVLYNRYAGEPYKHAGVEYLLIEVTEITAILEGM